jgi:hypothetical protein
MWPNTFSNRLESWNLLRSQCQSLPVEQTLININQWWFNVPWRPYYLHWDDQATWPDPWQLLSDNVYCDLARGLGILYTITLLDRADLEPVDLVLTEEGHNLVQVAKEKYILNWNKDSILNNKPKVKIIRQLKQHQIK